MVRTSRTRVATTVKRSLAALGVVLLAALGAVTMPTAANAAAGDFDIALSGPTGGIVTMGFSYNYVATINFEGVDSSHPATGVVLTTTLPAGTEFTSVPSGPGSTVLAHSYVASTRVLTLILNPATESVVSIVYTVTQISNTLKYEGFPLVTSMSGTGGPGGKVTSDPITTLVTGNNNYSTGKSSETIAGSDNRTVTYRFNITTTTPTVRSTFTTYSQTLTDTLPAGAQLVSSSPTWNSGSWNTSAFPEVTWTRNANYGPSTNALDTTGQQIWLTVYYPNANGWIAGTRPPTNTVNVSTTDAITVPHGGTPGSAQSIAFGSNGGIAVGATKTESGAGDTAGFLSHLTQTAGSYVGPTGSPDVDELVLTDSGAKNTANESWFDHADISQIYVTFSPTLGALALPFSLEYQVDGSAAWQTFTAYPAGATVGSTSAPFILGVFTTGSSGWQTTGQSGLTLPVGSTLTGWRLTVAPGAKTVPINVEARVRMSFQPVFRGVDAGIIPAGQPAGSSPGIQTNTVTVEAGAATTTASSTYTPVDSVYVTTHVSAPTALSVGGSGIVTAGIVNQNPSETYTDSELYVVLPCGIFYDPSKAITTEPSTVGVAPTPTIGNGVTVDSTGRVKDANGCSQQVVKFSFDELAPMRAPGQANNRLVESYGWTYAIPVTVLASAYLPSATSVRTTSWSTSADPRFISVASGGTGTTSIGMGGNALLFAADSLNFDPVRARIGYSNDLTTINTAGGLLISKLSGATPDGPWGLDTTVGENAYWQILVNNILPNPVSTITFFDKLPSISDGDDFDTLLSGAIVDAPTGATVEYSTDATSATNGTWTSPAAGATAFRVTITGLTNGNTFTLTVPTVVLGDTEYGDAADNSVSAAGIYNGNPVTFASNVAAVNILASPALELVKKTNGVEYSAAPGAIVANDSPVTWTYDVTNTGDVALDDVAVADEFTAGDDSEGELEPTSTTTGLLLPGETRTFTATGTAIEGQYENTATATGTAVDGLGEELDVQPDPQTDDSWYFAGDSGLTIVKTTNGEDVDSAPGLPLSPGDEVEWAYTVTNSGTLSLTDVLVEDRDSAGALVFSDTIETLAPGASVSLSASGVATAGQYHNVVTATADDPSGSPEPLTSADDSWYFGTIAGLEVAKRVSASADGPWTETVELTIGTASFWQIVVTNSGNSALTDVSVKDAELDETIGVGTLAAGESRTIALTLGETTRAFTNVAVATGTALDATELEATDDASVTVVELSPDDEVPEDAEPGSGTDTGADADSDSPTQLAMTGVAVTGSLLSAACLVAVGVILLLRRRRGQLVK